MRGLTGDRAAPAPMRTGGAESPGHPRDLESFLAVSAVSVSG